ncbi:24697_t:CDS:1, partial [Gigaspora margarita]
TQTPDNNQNDEMSKEHVSEIFNPDNMFYEYQKFMRLDLE